MDINKYRVSLKFDENSSEHKKALSVLKQLGRKKSEFITMCVVEYLENQDNFNILELQKELGTGGFRKSNKPNDTVDMKDDMEGKKNKNKKNKKVNSNSSSKGSNDNNVKQKQKDNVKDEVDNDETLNEDITEDEIPEIPTIESISPATENEEVDEEEELTEEEKQDLLDSLKMFQ